MLKSIPKINACKLNKKSLGLDLKKTLKNRIINKLFKNTQSDDQKYTFTQN